MEFQILVRIFGPSDRLADIICRNVGAVLGDRGVVGAAVARSLRRRNLGERLRVEIEHDELPAPEIEIIDRGDVCEQSVLENGQTQQAIIEALRRAIGRDRMRGARVRFYCPGYEPSSLRGIRPLRLRRRSAEAIGGARLKPPYVFHRPAAGSH